MMIMQHTEKTLKHVKQLNIISGSNNEQLRKKHTSQALGAIQ